MSTRQNLIWFALNCAQACRLVHLIREQDLSLSRWAPTTADCYCTRRFAGDVWYHGLMFTSHLTDLVLSQLFSTPPKYIQQDKMHLYSSGHEINIKNLPRLLPLSMDERDGAQ